MFFILDFQNPLSHSETQAILPSEIPDVAKICHITLNGNDDQFRLGIREGQIAVERQRPGIPTLERSWLNVNGFKKF